VRSKEVNIGKDDTIFRRLIGVSVDSCCLTADAAAAAAAASGAAEFTLFVLMPIDLDVTSLPVTSHDNDSGN